MCRTSSWSISILVDGVQNLGFRQGWLGGGITTRLAISTSGPLTIKPRIKHHRKIGRINIWNTSINIPQILPYNIPYITSSQKRPGSFPPKKLQWFRSLSSMPKQILRWKGLPQTLQNAATWPFSCCQTLGFAWQSDGKSTGGRQSRALLACIDKQCIRTIYLKSWGNTNHVYCVIRNMCLKHITCIGRP